MAFVAAPSVASPERVTPLRRLPRWMLALWLGSAAALAVFSVLRHIFYLSTARDLGLYVQNAWLIAHGQWHGTVVGLHVFADHLSPVLTLFAPTALLPGSVVLWEVGEALVVTAGVVPAYLLGRHLAGRTGGVLGPVWYGLSATLWYAVLFDVHPVLLGAPVLLWMMWRVEVRPDGVAALAAGEAVLVLVREDVAVLGAVVVAVAFLRTRRRSLLWVALAGAAVALLYVGFGRLLFGPDDGYLFWARYRSFGDGPLDILTGLPGHLGLVAERLTDHRALVVYGALLGPMLFLPFAGWRLAWPGLGLLVFNLLCDELPARTIAYQYHVQALPFLVWGALAAWRRLRDRSGLDEVRVARNVVVAASALFLLFGPVAGRSFAPLDRSFPGILGQGERRALNELVQQVPAGVAVAASSNLVPHLAERREVFEYPRPLECPTNLDARIPFTGYPAYLAISTGSGGEDPAVAASVLPDLGYRLEWSSPAGELWRLDGPPPAPKPCPVPGR